MTNFFPKRLYHFIFPPAKYEGSTVSTFNLFYTLTFSKTKRHEGRKEERGGGKEKRKEGKKEGAGTSLEVQWLRLCF